MKRHRMVKNILVYAVTLSIFMIVVLFISGCTQKHQSDDSDVQMIETEGDIEIIIPEDQDSGGF